MVSLLALTSIPFIGLGIYLNTQIADLIFHPLWIAGTLAFFSIPLLMADYLNRRTKNMLSWNGLDAFVVGVFQLIHYVPGAGRLIGAFSAGLLRNYDRHSAIKYAYLSFVPILILQMVSGTRGMSGSPVDWQANLNWLTHGTMMVVSCLSALLAMGGFIKSIENKRWIAYVTYRWMLAGAIVGFYFYQQAG